MNAYEDGMKIYIHSDDFGLSEKQAETLINLAGEGAINSLSVLTNDDYLAEHVTRLRAAAPDARLSVHVNFVEGKSLLEHAMLPDLTDERGCFKLSYGQLLLRSFLPGKRRLLGQMIAEARTQIVAMLYCMPKDMPLAIDTHQHTHAIPLVAKALAAAIRESGANVSAVRLPHEPIGPYLKHPKTLFEIPPVNFVKRALLNLLLPVSAKEFAAYPSPVFAGVLMTARVDAAHVLEVLPEFVELAKQRGKDLELLFHPARVEALSACPDPENEPFAAFNLSPRRDEEQVIVRALAREAAGLTKEEAAERPAARGLAS